MGRKPKNWLDYQLKYPELVQDLLNLSQNLEEGFNQVKISEATATLTKLLQEKVGSVGIEEFRVIFQNLEEEFKEADKTLDELITSLKKLKPSDTQELTTIARNMEEWFKTFKRIDTLINKAREGISSAKNLLELRKQNDIIDIVFLQGVENTTEEELDRLFLCASATNLLKKPVGELPIDKVELDLRLGVETRIMWKRWKESNVKHIGAGGVSEYSKNASKGPEVVYLHKEERVEDINNRWEIAHKEFRGYLDNLSQEDRTLWEVAISRGKIKTFGSKNNNDVITRRARKNLGEDYKEFIKVFEILRRLARERQELALELTSSKVSH